MRMRGSFVILRFRCLREMLRFGRLGTCWAGCDSAGLSFLTCPAKCKEKHPAIRTLSHFCTIRRTPRPPIPLPPTGRAWRGEPPPAAHSGAWGTRRKPLLRLSRLGDCYETKGSRLVSPRPGGPPGPIPTRPRRRVAQPGARTLPTARLAELVTNNCSRADFPSHGNKLCRNPDAKQEAKHWRW